MNTLELVQQVSGELSLPIPSLVVGNQDPQTIQMLALLRRLGTDLCAQFEWEKLNREHVLTTSAFQSTGNTSQGSPIITGIPSTAALSSLYSVSGTGVVPFSQIVSVDSATQVTLNMPLQSTGSGVVLNFSQTQYPLPSDWIRQIPQTEWDRTNRWPLMGPESSQSWQSFKSGIVYAGPRQRFRILGGYMTINPIPPNGLIFAFEYISNSWVLSASGARQSTILADTDTFLFSDSPLITGLKVQWRAAKGLDISFALSDFSPLLEAAKSHDKSAPKLSLSPYGGSVLMSGANIPDGNFPEG